MTRPCINKAKKLLESSGWSVIDYGEYIQIDLGIVIELTELEDSFVVVTDEDYAIQIPN